MRRLGVGVMAWSLVLGVTSVAEAHHVGTYIPKDTEVSANFKQLKFSTEAGKFDVALRLFEAGALRAEIQKLGPRLPAGFEEGLRGALRARDGRGAELRLMVLLIFLARDIAWEAERRAADPGIPETLRAVQVSRLLEALWRYYNLVDFALYQGDVKAALAVRLAFDDAESALGGGGSDPMKSGPRKAPSVDLARAREALGRLSLVLTDVIERSVQSTLAVPAGAGVSRP